MKTQNAVSLAVETFGHRNGLPGARGAQKLLAEKLGVTRQTVANWCKTGSVSVGHLERFSALTGVSAKEVNAFVRKVAD